MVPEGWVTDWLWGVSGGQALPSSWRARQTPRTESGVDEREDN